jgi:pyrimidine operon attenuation protein / uracil phosphoribosyltransferase
MSASSESRVLLGAEEVGAAVDRLAGEILAANQTGTELCFVGIQRGGVPLAERLAARVAARTGTAPPVGVLDISLYRDDIGAHPVPVVGPTRISFPITGRAVVLVDDVLYTGRTVRAALDELTDFGRPQRVWLAVLAERPGRELPIQADFVGARLQADAGETIEVRLREQGGGDEVVVQRRG